MFNKKSFSIFIKIHADTRERHKLDESQMRRVAARPAMGGGQTADNAAAVKSAEGVKAEPSQTAKMIDIAQIQGPVHAQSMQKVGELADKNPREVVSIIRQWMNQSHVA